MSDEIKKTWKLFGKNINQCRTHTTYNFLIGYFPPNDSTQNYLITSTKKTIYFHFALI
jgi:hypothetical protein